MALVGAVSLPSKLEYCNEPVPIGRYDIEERFEKEMLLTLGDQPQVILWLKRSPRYLPLIDEMLRKHGLPPDLKFIPVIESSLRPHAGSSKGAIGFWQFTRATGRRYGLTIDGYCDERRNIQKSTMAAIKYLKKLYQELGTWSLAVAGYNMGEAGLKSEIKAQKVKDFYDLYLPLETQRFLFKIISAKLILTQPRQYGFTLTVETLYSPYPAEPVILKAPADLEIELVATAAKTHFKMIKDLNPELRGYVLRKGMHAIYIPKSGKPGFKMRYRHLIQKRRSNPQRFIYVVQPGDSLSGIAENFHVSLASLYRLNKLSRKKYIQPGERLVIKKGL